MIKIQKYRFIIITQAMASLCDSKVIHYHSRDRNVGQLYNGKSITKSRQKQVGKIKSNKCSRSPHLANADFTSKSIMISQFNNSGLELEYPTQVCIFKPKSNKVGKICPNKRRNHQANSFMTNNQENIPFKYGQRRSSKAQQLLLPSRHMKSSQSRISNCSLNKKIELSQAYQQKMQAYQKTKCQFMREMSNRTKDLKEINFDNNCRTEEIGLLQKMKKTLKLSENQQIEGNGDESESIEKLRTCLQQQIKLQNQLRNLKGKISHFNRSNITSKFKNKVKEARFKGKYCEYDIEQMLSIQFEEYDPLQFLCEKPNLTDELLDNLLSQLIENYEETHKHWNQQLKRSHPKKCIQKLIEYSVKHDNKPRNLEVSLYDFENMLKGFLKQQIKKKQIYRIYKKMQPVSHSNIRYILSK